MPINRRKKTREHDVTGRYLAGDFDEDNADKQQRFSNRSKNATQDKIEKTTAARRPPMSPTPPALNRFPSARSFKSIRSSVKSNTKGPSGSASRARR